MAKAKTKVEAPVVEIIPDPVCEQLVALGLVPNSYHLDLNRGLTVPAEFRVSAPWNLPSRLFQFPIEVGELDCNGQRRIGLMHPEMRTHPYIRHVEDLMGLSISEVGAPNLAGYSKSRIATWWHAVDLMSEQHWKDLLETRQFTTDDDIIRAVELALSGNRITPLTARSVMRAVGVETSEDALALLCKFAEPQEVVCDGVTSWPVNRGSGSPQDRAWGIILAIEAGWLKFRACGFIGWSELGRSRYAQGPGAVFVETPSGQGAFAF